MVSTSSTFSLASAFFLKGFSLTKLCSVWRSWLWDCVGHGSPHPRVESMRQISDKGGAIREFGLMFHAKQHSNQHQTAEHITWHGGICNWSKALSASLELIAIPTIVKKKKKERKGLEGKLQLWSRDGLKLEDARESYAGNLQRVGQLFMEHLPLSFKYVLGCVRGMGRAE